MPTIFPESLTALTQGGYVARPLINGTLSAAGTSAAFSPAVFNPGDIIYAKIGLKNNNQGGNANISCIIGGVSFSPSVGPSVALEFEAVIANIGGVPRGFALSDSIPATPAASYSSAATSSITLGTTNANCNYTIWHLSPI
jgi:hypothetical protein